MVSLPTWFRYMAHKLEYSVTLSWKSNFTLKGLLLFFQGLVMSLNLNHYPFYNTSNDANAVCFLKTHVGICLMCLLLPFSNPYLVTLDKNHLDGSYKHYKIGQITERDVGDTIWRNVFQGKLTYLHWNRGEEMAPTVAAQGGTLLVRKLPYVDPTNVFVGDIVVMKDPEKPDDCLVRRLVAVEGYEMVSNDEKDEPFVLQKDECWVLSDNESLKSKEARDSRTFGPVCLADIVGRVIYSLRTAVDHGPVQNSRFGMYKDSPVLAVELDVDEMAKNHKA